MASFKEILRDITKILNNVKKDTETHKKIGRSTVTDIKKRTREGQGVTNGRLTRFPPLKSTTVKRRFNLLDNGKLDKFTSPLKSNRTQSGELVRSIRAEAKTDGFELFFQGKKNNEKANLNPEPAILDLTKEEEDKIAKEYSRIIARIFNKL